MTLADLEAKLQQQEQPVFFIDVDLALATEVSEAVNRAEKLRRILREKHRAKMEQAFFETARV